MQLSLNVLKFKLNQFTALYPTNTMPITFPIPKQDAPTNHAPLESKYTSL